VDDHGAEAAGGLIVGTQLNQEEDTMLLIREIMYCKPGKVRPMVEKSLAMAKLMEKGGHGKLRVLTDFVAERYWTAIMEFEVKDLKAFDDMMAGVGMSDADNKEFEKVMAGYHDLIEYGKREIYKIEQVPAAVGAAR
jgi:hypothetical protein